MRKAIDTVPKNGDFVILEDDALARYAIARWSSDQSQWVDDGGTPCPLNPTHWHPMNSSGHVPEPADELGVAAAQAGPAAMRAHRAAKRQEQALRPARPRGKRLAAARAGLQVWGKTLTAAQRRYRLPAAVSGLLVIAAAGAWSYQSEIADFSDRLLASATSELAQARQALREEQEKLDRQAAELMGAQRQPEAPPSAEGGPLDRAESDRLRDELATAKREIETQTARARAADDEVAKANEANARLSDEGRQALRAEVEKAAQLRDELAALGREIEARTASARTASEEAAKAKEAMTLAADQFRRALGEERDKAKNLGGELAAAKREVEVQAASLRAASEEAAKVKAANARTADELRLALQDERSKAEKLGGELATAKREVETQVTGLRVAADEAAKAKAANARTADELRQALQDERSKAEKLGGELATARREVETQVAGLRAAADEAAKAKAADARTTDELRQALQDERSKAEKLGGELATARREVETQVAGLRAAADEAAKAKAADARTADELRQALQDERDQTGKLRAELAAAARKETQATTGHAASDEAETATRAAVALGRELRAERDGIEKLQRELEALARERDEQAALSRAASDEVARLKEASARLADEDRRALQAERSRAEKLAGELDRARAEFDKMAKATASDEAARKSELVKLRQGLQQEMAAALGARETAEAERIRRQQLEQQLASRAEAQSDRRISAERAAPASHQAKPAAATMPSGGAARPAAAPLQADAETVRLLARAGLLMEQGNIAAARNMLDRAAETGSPEAVFALAETYDPAVLAARQTFGTQSDAARARELYARALAGGVAEAKARLDALRQ